MSVCRNLFETFSSTKRKVFLYLIIILSLLIFVLVKDILVRKYPIDYENTNLKSSFNETIDYVKSATGYYNYNPDVVSMDDRRHDEPPSNRIPGFPFNGDKLYQPPANEYPERRFPQCVIIGFGKCGTRALNDLLGLHPCIKVYGQEVHFYDKDEKFNKGFEWYRQKMPYTYSNQITMEKTPAYVLTRRARDEIFKLTPKVKLIILVRDPVVRLVSHFMQANRYALLDEHRYIPVNTSYLHHRTGRFDPTSVRVDVGVYYKHVKMWLDKFPRDNILVLNSEELVVDPLPLTQRVEAFLKVPPMLTEKNIYKNETTGFYCFRKFDPKKKPFCLGKYKGMPHPKLPPKDEQMLYDFYRPWNEKFFELVGERFDWKEREWKKNQ